jgi:ribosomal protein S12 methylthiotransferase
VLVEKEAAARDLQQSNVSSWEHGLIREASGANGDLSGRYWVARGEADAPDIDGRVYVQAPRRSSSTRIAPGEFAEVEIVGHTDYDLIARLVQA